MNLSSRVETSYGYIKPPRSTIDADFVTRTLNDHESVRQHLEAICYQDDESIRFAVVAFEPIEKKNNLGASVTIRYTTREGQQNTFDLDIVYAVSSDTTRISSPIDSATEITVVTLENIIADKLSASHLFKGGNTRMKGFDDLWRISRFKEVAINWNALRSILGSRGIEPILYPEWQNELLRKSWRSHLTRNKGLPDDITVLMADVNEWLKNGLGL